MTLLGAFAGDAGLLFEMYKRANTPLASHPSDPMRVGLGASVFLLVPLMSAVSLAKNNWELPQNKEMSEKMLQIPCSLGGGVVAAFCAST